MNEEININDKEQAETAPVDFSKESPESILLNNFFSRTDRWGKVYLQKIFEEYPNSLIIKEKLDDIIDHVIKNYIPADQANVCNLIISNKIILNNNQQNKLFNIFINTTKYSGNSLLFVINKYFPNIDVNHNIELLIKIYKECIYNNNDIGYEINKFINDPQINSEQILNLILNSSELEDYFEYFIGGVNSYSDNILNFIKNNAAKIIDKIETLKNKNKIKYTDYIYQIISFLIKNKFDSVFLIKLLSKYAIFEYLYKLIINNNLEITNELISIVLNSYLKSKNFDIYAESYLTKLIEKKLIDCNSIIKFFIQKSSQETSLIIRLLNNNLITNINLLKEYIIKNYDAEISLYILENKIELFQSEFLFFIKHILKCGSNQNYDKLTALISINSNIKNIIENNEETKNLVKITETPQGTEAKIVFNFAAHKKLFNDFKEKQFKNSEEYKNYFFENIIKKINEGPRFIDYAINDLNIITINSQEERKNLHAKIQEEQLKFVEFLKNKKDWYVLFDTNWEAICCNPMFFIYKISKNISFEDLYHDFMKNNFQMITTMYKNYQNIFYENNADIDLRPEFNRLKKTNILNKCSYESRNFGEYTKYFSKIKASLELMHDEGIDEKLLVKTILNKSFDLENVNNQDFLYIMDKFNKNYIKDLTIKINQINLELSNAEAEFGQAIENEIDDKNILKNLSNKVIQKENEIKFLQEQMIKIFDNAQDQLNFNKNNYINIIEKINTESRKELVNKENFINNFNIIASIIEKYNKNENISWQNNTKEYVALKQFHSDIEIIENYETIIEHISQAKPKDEKLFNFQINLPNNLNFTVLKYLDPYAFKVGADTNCCQRIGGAGEAAAIDSYINPLAGVLLLKIGQDLLAQSYFHYVPEDNGLILDNIEANDKNLNKYRINETNLSKIYENYAKSIKEKYPDIAYVKCGIAYSRIDVKLFNNSKIKKDPRHFEVDRPYSDFDPNKHLDLLQPTEVLQQYQLKLANTINNIVKTAEDNNYPLTVQLARYLLLNNIYNSFIKNCYTFSP